MGWETNVPTMISFNKETYSDLSSVNDRINKEIEVMDYCLDEMLVLLLASPVDIVKTDEEINSISGIKNKFKELLDTYVESEVNIFKLRCLKDNFKCVGGDFIENPNYKEGIKEWVKKEGILDNIDYYEKDN
jgi:hypothetical protein